MLPNGIISITFGKNFTNGGQPFEPNDLPISLEKIYNI